MEARLQAVLSRNMYSEQGFEALMRPPSGQVCHSLIVVSYCIPGSAHAQVAKEMSCHNFSAEIDLTGFPLIRPIKSQFSPFSSALKNAFGTRTELFEFCPETVR